MGLSITVGESAQIAREEGYDVFAGRTAAINTILERMGRPLHVEPLDIPDEGIVLTGIGVVSPLMLRRLAAHLVLYGAPPPAFGDGSCHDALGDEACVMMEALSLQWREATIEALMSPRPVPREPRFNQLLSPSTYFVPQDASPLPVLYGEDGIGGGTVGSSVRLLAECEEILNHFDLPDGLDPDDEERWMAMDGSWRAYDSEIICALRFIKACRASVRHGALVVFS